MFTNPQPVKIEETSNKIVYSAEGKRQKVTKVKKIKWKGKIYHIKPRLLFPFTATQNHPFLVLEKPPTKQFKLREFNRINKNIEKYLKWKRAEELTTKDLLIYPELKHPHKYQEIKIIDKTPRNIPKKIKIDEEIAELFGWYLAEGYSRIDYKKRRYCMVFALGYEEMNYIKKLQKIIKKRFNLNSSIRTQPNKSIELITYSKTLAELFKELFKTGAKDKIIPKIIFESPKSVKLKFLKAYIEGDGHESNDVISVATTSKNISEDIIFLFSSLGIFPTCSYRKMKDSKIDGRKIKGPKIYEFNITGKQMRKLGNKRGKFQHYFTKGNFHFIPIKETWSENYEGDIINMETEDGTYLMPCITHNSGAQVDALLGTVLHDPLQSFSSTNKIIKKNGKKVNISTEVNKLLKKHEKDIIKKEGYLAAYLRKDELYILAEKNGKIQPVEVLSINKYKSGKPYLYKITTESGKTLTVTPEHKVAVNIKEKQQYIQASKLKKGKEIFVK